MAQKKSEILQELLSAKEAEREAKEAEFNAKHPCNEPGWEDAWREYYRSMYRPLSDEISELEFQIAREKNREIEVGDGVTYHLWSDSYACTVIARTKKTLTIQRDKATLDPNFKPEWIPGGFSAICTNCEDQSWTYERDPNGTVYVCHWSEKKGRYQSGEDGSIRISRGRHEYYDYNF